MDLATQTHLTQLRDLLTYRLGELRADVHAAQLARQASTSAMAQEVTDRKDDAAQHQFDDLDSVQERRDIEELAQVEAALKRLDAGTYGNCTRCGEPIALERLRVQPAALRCAPCQITHEHTHRSTS